MVAADAPQPMTDTPALVEPMQVSVKVVVKAGAYTCGVVSSLVVCSAGELLVMLSDCALPEVAAPLDAALLFVLLFELVFADVTTGL